MTTNEAPRVSVVLPVHNGGNDLRDAIDSILAQTVVDLDLVVVDDASSDDSLAIARAVSDSRIRVFALDTNRGLAATLNFGIEQAKAPLIARQDQDDVSHPTRLARQLEVLDACPGIVLIGTWARIVRRREDGADELTGLHHHPTTDAELRVRLLWNNPFVHSSVVFRRDAFELAGRYGTDPVANWPEDYDLWVRLAKVGEIANVPEELVTYRQTTGGMSDAYEERIRAGVIRIGSRQLASSTGLEVGDAQLVELVRILNGLPSPRVSPVATLRRVRLFLRVSRNAGRSSLAVQNLRIQGAAKLAIRSLAPRHATIRAK